MIKGLDEYIAFLDECRHLNNYSSVGAIVMNANPFTNGHQYLINKALDNVDYLYVFVIEEDKSFFSFNDRFNLVKSNCANFQNVSVIPTGNFIISQNTFGGYFQKENATDSDVNSMDFDPTIDVQIFGERIAKVLNITTRFAGSEPNCKVTNRYNETMKNLLPIYGVNFVEIERLEVDNNVVSATTVRNFIKNKEFEKIKPLVPEITYNFIREKYERD